MTSQPSITHPIDFRNSQVDVEDRPESDSIEGFNPYADLKRYSEKLARFIEKTEENYFAGSNRIIDTPTELGPSRQARYTYLCYRRLLTKPQAMDGKPVEEKRLHLAALAGVSVRTLTRHNTELEEWGWIKKRNTGQGIAIRLLMESPL